MELIHEIFYAVVCVEIILCEQAEVIFSPDSDIDVLLPINVLKPPVEVTTTQCYTYPPRITVQYVKTDDSNVVYDVFDSNNTQPVGDGACGKNKIRYRATLRKLAFIADPVLVGGTFRLKATVDYNEENGTLSRRTYTFSAPFNLTGSSASAVLGSEFKLICHVTSDNPIIQWTRDRAPVGQAGFLENTSCVTDNQTYPYLYECQESVLTYTLTIPGPYLTEELQATQWRCKEAGSGDKELKGSSFIKLDIIVPVTNVLISPGSGSFFDADENQTATFTCITNNANPAPTILWYIGSSDVTPQAGSNKTTLTVYIGRAEHLTSVRCEAWNRGNTGNISDSTTLNVRFPPSNNEELQITGYTSGKVLYENNQAMISITCTQPGGNPFANLTLTCGSETGTIENTTTEIIGQLSLANDRTLNGKNCTCVSTHINGYMRSQSFSLIVYYPPSTPNVNISSPFPWKANESQNLTCNTTPGNPPATTYIWKEGELELSTMSPTYIINPLQSSDNGRTLHCQVNNNFTLHENVVLTSANTILQVLYPPANDQELQIMGYASGQVLYEKNPTVIGINCTQPGGNPVANITFTCASKPGTSGDTTTEAIQRLNLTNDRNLNDQNCTCVSTHINGYRRSKSLSFIVYYPPSTPTIRNSSSFPWKAPGIYNLTCYSNSGNPQATTYTWIEGGSDLPIKARTYEFNPLNSTDNGRQLKCQVRNNFTVKENVNLISNATKMQVEYDPVVTLEQSSVEVIEGKPALLRCSATGNPVPNVTWYRNSKSVTGSTFSSSNYSIENASRMETGNYMCVAISSSAGSNIMNPDNKTTHLRVFYPPTVQILFQNTTENTENHIIRCSAEGDPNNSTFVALHQRIGSASIRNITSFTQFPPGNMTLNINMVSYQDMGTYTCLASNGIPDRSNQMVQSDSGYFNVITSAKFEMDQYTVRADIDTEAVVKIPFYRNPPATESDVVWTSNTATSNGTVMSSANVSLSLNDTDVQQKFYGVDITLRGQSAIMNITSFQNYYEGNYTLKIRSNHADSAEVTVTLIRSGPPDTPSYFQLLSSKVTSVVLTWNKGSDGGHQQTFVVLYKEKTAVVYDVKQIIDTTVNVTITDEIKHLKSDTSYEFILYSFNEKGNSTGYKTLGERTLKETSPSSLNSGLVGGAAGGGAALLVIIAVLAVVLKRRRNKREDNETSPSSLNSGLVGGAAGGGAALLVIIVVLLVVLKWRRNKREDNGSKGILNGKEMSAGPSKQSDEDEDEGGLKDNPLYGSSPGGANAVQGASAAPENLSQYAAVVKPKKKTPAKESVDPPPIYAEVDKSKKKGKGLMKLKKQSPPRVGEDPPPIYAEVDKSNKKNGKGKQQKQKTYTGDAYEVVDGFKEKETQFNDPADTQKNKEGGQRGYRNQDGLLYVYVKFDQPPPTGKPVIRGEERTGYAMIEFEEPPTYSTADDVQGAEGGE